MATRVPAANTLDFTGPVYVTATTGAVTWGLARWVFPGQVPAEVYLWVQLTIPLGMGKLAAWWRLRSARSRPRQFES